LGVLYIVAAEAAAGKTALCAGLAVNFLNDGKKVGYLKPQTTEKDGSDGDIIFMKQLLDLEDVVNATDVIMGRDIVLVEAGLGATPDDKQTKDTYGAAREMKARVIAVEAYTERLSGFTDVYRGFGDSLLGVVLNKVPESRAKAVREKAKARFEVAGTKLLGVIPEDRVLLAITIGELAESIQGTVLNNPDKAGEVVENYMLGAMVVGSGTEYFKRKNSKAAVIRNDRPDMQLAALETSTACLVISGGHRPPINNVAEKARSKGIPLIATELGSAEVVDRVEAALEKGRLNQAKKTKRLAELVKQNLDIKSIA
jgi:BioD-like phosphotransacetylase family protein